MFDCIFLSKMTPHLSTRSFFVSAAFILNITFMRILAENELKTRDGVSDHTHKYEEIPVSSKNNNNKSLVD